MFLPTDQKKHMTDKALDILSTAGLQQFQALQIEAVIAVTERFYSQHGSLYARFGERGREFCREDLAFHLEFLRPVLEFGLLQPMIDYLQWLNAILLARTVPTEHLALSLDWLAEFFAERMQTEHATVVVAALQSALAGFQAVASEPLMPRLTKEPWPEAAVFEAALLRGNKNAAHAVLSRCRAQGHSLIGVELHVIQPALYQIGEKWQANQVSVAQEHLATAIAQSVMSVALQNTQPLPALDKRVLLACVEGNNHAMGLQMVADAFFLAGWEVEFLGANVPTRALIDQVRLWQPDLIGLSVSFPQQVRVAKTVINELIAQFGQARPSVILGGLAFNRFNGLVDVVGADSFALDSQTAVALASRIIKREHKNPGEMSPPRR
jgi:methanogenic corrinoid protein MtbC1